MSVDKDLDKLLDNIDERAVGEINRPIEQTYRTQAKADLIKWAEELVDKVIGRDDRDYSHDNADAESLKILVATSTACNDLRADQRKRAKDIFKEVK